MQQDDISAGGRLTPVSAKFAGEVDNAVSTITLGNAFQAEFYDALGRVAVAFGRLEYSMLIVMKRLQQANRKSKNQPLLSLNAAILEDFPINFEECDKQAPTLYAKLVTDSTRQSEFDALVSKAHSMWKNERNDCLHCCWTSADGGAMRLRPKKVRDAAGDWTLTWEPSGVVKIEDLLGIARGAEEVASHIREFTKA